MTSRLSHLPARSSPAERRTHRRRLVWAALAWVLALPLLFAVPANAAPRQGTELRIDPTAQCHGRRCFVRIDVDAAAQGRLVVRAGSVRRAMRVTAGASTRIVALPRPALDTRVVATLDGVSTRRSVRVDTVQLNRRSRCARLAPSDVWLSVGPPNPIDAVVNLPSTGTLRVALLAVDFPGTPGSGDPLADHLPWIEEGIATLEAVSGGRFSMEVVAATSSWVRMPRRAAAYGLGDGATYDEHQTYIADAIAAADPQVDFTGVDLPLVVVPDTTPIFGGLAFRGVSGALASDEGELGPAVTFGGDALFLGSGLVPHEVAHTLGLPDLYSFDGFDQHEFVGIWDFMGSIFEPWTDLFVWNRTRLGWLRPTQTLCNADGGTTYAVLQPSSGVRGAVKSVFVRTGSHTGVVVENRQAVGLDAAICQAGALVATLDSRTETGFGPIRVIGGRPDDFGCGNGARSDAPARVGATRSTGDVTVEVVGRRGRALEVIVTVSS